MRSLEVVAHPYHSADLIGIAQHFDVASYWQHTTTDPQRTVTRMLVAPGQLQPVLDAVQGALSADATARIVVQSVDAALPIAGNGAAEETREESAERATREELYAAVGGSARLSAQYLLLVMLSTVVAVTGLLENNVAVVIGAMVIAPLLGPNLALALGTTLGDRWLMARALRTGLAGLALAVGLGALVGLTWPSRVQSPELLLRTEVGLESIALALASGAAAVLSLTTGLPTVLVGVMVAVALLPPAAALGITLGAAEWDLSAGAALLLAANVASVNLAANVVFLARGLRPRTWRERRRARQAMATYTALWIGSLGVIMLAIVARGST